MASTVTPTAPIRLPLTQLKRGDRAVVEFDASEVVPTGLSAEDREILRAMGLDERRAFTVCRAGKAGPCIIQVEATRLGLSPELARRIMTRPCECVASDCCAADDAGATAATAASAA
ncbi:MAG: FeoA domain, partial [Planctomycetota bacterium]